MIHLRLALRITSKLDPLKADTDDNGTPDGHEDFDQDGLTNLLENELKTNITKKDSDEDGLLDGFEYDHGNLEELNPTLKEITNNNYQ